ncbi:hypothetical protein D3C72_2307730 [compost metagenome]
MAPTPSRITVSALLAKLVSWLVQLPVWPDSNDDTAKRTNRSSQRRCQLASTAWLLSVSIAPTVSTRKAWLSAPSANLSSSFLRSSGLTM